MMADGSYHLFRFGLSYPQSGDEWSRREKEQKVQNSGGGGIDASDGKTWFRSRLIGRGAQGSVYLAESKSFCLFPFKMAVKSALVRHCSSLEREKRAFSVLNGGPNLVGCLGYEITRTDSGEKVLNLLLPYCSGGSLADHIKRSKNGLPEPEVASLARDIARGLQYMHNKLYAHCDIKPQNILLVPIHVSSSQKVKYVAKIADLGLSLRVVDGEEDRFRIRGTTPYMAPEMLRDVEIELPVDIWSFGCTVLEMLTGKPAWGAELMKKSNQELKDYIAYSYESPQIPDHISEKAKDFLHKCLDPVWGFDRWPAGKLLRHPFLLETTATL